jgi:type IV pilus biogenesis protein CpaD/CtpE
VGLSRRVIWCRRTIVSRIVIALATALALAGCAARTGSGGPAIPDGKPSQALTIDGALAYRER